MATARSRRSTSQASLQAALIRSLASCATEADIVQLLYSHLYPVFGYDPINLHVLEREGWYHSRAVDRGLLQDVRRRRLSESIFESNYAEPRTVVSYPTPHILPVEYGRGPGGTQIPLTVIWVPVLHQGQVIGAIIYQLHVRRPVPKQELALLEEVHAHMGVVVGNAYLNELTRNQAMSLAALNEIARALSATRDEFGVVTALRSTLGPLIPIDELELVVAEEPGRGRLRSLRMVADTLVQERARASSTRFATAREVLANGRSILAVSNRPRQEYRSEACVPVKEGPTVSAALTVRSSRADAYEQSTLHFLQQVANQVGLALRHAWSFAALEAQREHLELANVALEGQRRRLEVADSVGRRLASCLDRRSIMRTLRRELSRHLEFDLLSLAAVTETADGPKAEAYVDDSGHEKVLSALPLTAAGPAQQAFETGRPVLMLDSLRPEESEGRAMQARGSGESMVLDITGPDPRRPVTARSIVWVPVLRGERITALLSLQAHRPGVFDGWHVQLLQDVAAHVSLALATAEQFQLAETERRRLEALHVLETGAAGATEERQVAEALFRASEGSMETSNLLLVYLDSQGEATGYGTEGGRPAEPLAPKPVERTHFFRRLIEEGRTIAEGTPLDQRQRRPGLGWPSADNRMPVQVIWVPVRQGDRVVAALSAQRYEDVPFAKEEVDLLESAAPVVGIALRTVRLHRANELALSHSVRIQEVAALAGHDLDTVVASVAEQARSMLAAAGAACWALTEDGRIAAHGAAGDGAASRVLSWSRRGGRRDQALARTHPVIGRRRWLTWTLFPLHYADHLVGALGFVQPEAALAESIEAPIDFARHAAIAIENARLAAETRGRIHTLEAVAAFADLDITRPARAHAEMGRLVERALASSHGRLWLLEETSMVLSASARDSTEPVELPLPQGRDSRSRAANLRSFRLGLGAIDPSQVLTTPIQVEGQLVGVLSAEEGGSSPAETRRLMSVLASQATLVLGRLKLVGALNSQARTMEAILTHSPVGVVLEDAAGVIVYANPTIERIYRVSPDSLLGAPADQLLSRAGATLIAAPDPAPGAPVELRIGEKVVHLRRVRIPSSNTLGAGVLTLHEDITEEKATLDAKDLMLRAIGHEVRSPAAAMRGTIASLLQWEEVIDPKQRRDLMEKAYEQSERLLNLAEAQLTIAKLEGGGFEPKAMEVPLLDTLQQVMQVLLNRYGRRVEAVEYHIPSRLPNASCEPPHLEQALTNLIGNGLEHSWATRILVTARHDGDWLEVSIEDNGRGLPQDRVDVLFSRPGAAGQHRARGGLGLGLYLCRLIVERSFGGRIWLERTGPGCSIFKFTVPAAGPGGRRRAMRTARGSTLSPTRRLPAPDE